MIDRSPEDRATGTTPAAGLACRVDERDVELDLTVASGRRLAVVGANGSGKSTALALLAGHLRPDSGRVDLHGEVVSSAARHVPAHRRHVVSLEQHPGLFPHLSAVANVAFGPRSRGVRRARALQRARSELEAVGCGALADRRPHQLSGGQAQRVALARALAVDPELVLLDEPLAALDVGVAPEIRRLLADRLSGRTVVMVTHDPLDLWSLAQDVVVLEHGRAVQSGPVEEVLARPGTDFAARLAGISLIDGIIDDHDSLRTSGGDTVAGVRSTGSPWEIGSRAIATIDPRAVAVHRAGRTADEPAPATAADDRTPGGTAQEQTARVPGTGAISGTGSARNAWPARVVGLEPTGSLTLVTTQLRDGHRVDAEITSRSAAELALGPGVEVVLVVKAAQVMLYPRPVDDVSGRGRP